MPILTLGFVVGTIVTKAVRSLMEPCFEPQHTQGDSGETPTPEAADPFEQDLWALTGTFTAVPEPVTAAPSHTVQVWKDPCSSICRFPNRFNNCWMNATLQATLNLNIVRDILTQQLPEELADLSDTPDFAELFLKALRFPGMTFSVPEIRLALRELCTLPGMSMGAANDPIDLLEPLLHWLDRCGVETILQMREGLRCEGCSVATGTPSSLGPVYFLPQPGERDTTSSLLRRALGQDEEGRCCAFCGCAAQVVNVTNCPDVLTLNLVRSGPGGSVHRAHVSPSAFISIPAGEHAEQLYSMSATICHSGWSAYDGHYWSYLFRDHTTIKANDRYISVTPKGGPDDIKECGVIYLYEKVTVPPKDEVEEEGDSEVPPCAPDDRVEEDMNTPERIRGPSGVSITTPGLRGSLLSLIQRPAVHLFGAALSVAMKRQAWLC